MFSFVVQKSHQITLLHVLAYIHHLSNSTFQGTDLWFHSSLLKTVSCHSPGCLGSFSHIFKPLFSSSTHIFSSESQAFPQRPIFPQHQISMCLLQILNNCSSNTSKNVMSNFFLEELDEISAPVHRSQGSAADLFWWNLSLCSQVPVAESETGQTKNIVLAVGKNDRKYVPDFFLSFHKLHEYTIKKNY